ncbi:DUF4132 domain-containing protein [Actinoplanes sp. NPDC051851]|uniref:DUF4132 domain-containing protein n=1 Tax=Actinoplanes sp. NPDC051851 TaxID=3154753 RepID=UPI00342B9013
MSRFVRLDEDAWVVPQAWREGLHPRRGGVRAERVIPDDAVERLRDHLGSERYAKIQAKVTGDRAVLYDAGLTRRVHDDGDPVGAAVAALLGFVWWDIEYATLLADAWVARFGVVFAARATGEMARLVAGCGLWRVDPEPAKTYEELWRGDDLKSLCAVAREVRAHLAVASENDYRQAGVALAEFRTSPVERIVTSYLAPAETAWVDEDCAAAAGWGDGPHALVRGDHRVLRVLLLLAASSVGHLRLLSGNVTGYLLPYEPIGEVGTIMDGVGPAAAAILAGPFYRELLRVLHERKSYVRGTRLGPGGLRLLANTPDDEAFRTMCRVTIGAPATRPGALLKSGVLNRYPVRAARILRELVADHAGTVEGAVYQDILGAVATGVPEEDLGKGWAALLDRHWREPWRHLVDGSDDEKRVIGALAAIPTEQALGLLVDRIEHRHVRPALLAAAKRDPELARRVLTEKAENDQVIAELLRNHELAYPASAPAEDGLTPKVLDGPLRRSDGRLMRAPALPEWLVIASLPEVPLLDGSGHLSRKAVRRLCEMLAASTIGNGHTGIAKVRLLGHPASLAALAWAILDQWRAAEYPAPSKLAMVALAQLGDDTSVTGLTALFPGWAGSSMRVRTGMDVLAAIGSDVALTHLHRLAGKARTEGFRRLAQQRLDGIAQERGLSPEQLADRIVPDFGLDVDARISLGHFMVAFDNQFRPWVTDRNGARLARPTTPAAQRRLTDLKREVQAVVADRTRALEEAMVTGRRWTAAEFPQLMVEHPLMWQLTQRLVWAVFDERDTVIATFRAAEDRSLADLDDNAWKLDPDTTVGVAHPWHLGADRARWAAIFADHAIVQPFPQLGRELLDLSEKDLRAATGTEVAGRRLFMLSHRGWTFNQGHTALVRRWPGDRTVEIGFRPGYVWDDPELPQHLAAVRVAAGLDPVARSEVARDLRILTDGAC